MLRLALRILLVIAFLSLVSIQVNEARKCHPGQKGVDCLQQSLKNSRRNLNSLYLKKQERQQRIRKSKSKSKSKERASDISELQTLDGDLHSMGNDDYVLFGEELSEQVIDKPKFGKVYEVVSVEDEELILRYGLQDTELLELQEDDDDDEPVQVMSVKSEKQIDQFKSFTMNSLKNTTNEICKRNEAIIVFGVSISKCSVDWSNKNLVLKGVMNMFNGKLNGHVTVEIVNTGNNKGKEYYLSLELTQKKTFQISSLIPSLKNSALDNVKFRNPKIIIVSSNHTSFNAKPGITFEAEIHPGSSGQNSHIQSLAPLLGRDAFFKSHLSLSGKADISELKNPSKTSFALVLSVNRFNSGTSRVQCAHASISITNQTPPIKISGECDWKLKANSHAKIQLIYEAKSVSSFSIGGTVVGQVKNAFHISGLTLQKAGIKGVLQGGSLTELKLDGQVSLKSKQYQFSGDIFKGLYTFGVSSIGINELFTTLGIPKNLSNKVPNLTMKNVKITIQTTTNDKNPSFRIESELNGKVVNFNVAAKASVQVDKDHININGSLSDTSFKVGPITISNPALNINAKRQESSASVQISGNATLWSMKNLITRADFVRGSQKSGYSVGVKLEKNFRLSQISSSLSNTPLKALHFKDPELRYSTIPMKYIDNVERMGAVFQAKVGLDDMPEMLGVKILFGGKLQELPLVLPFGGSGLSIGAPQNLQIIAILPYGIPIKSKYIQFLAPISMTIGMGTPPSFGLNCDIIIRFPGDGKPLHFRISFKLNSLGADAAAETMNEWKHPFGLKGVTIKKLGLDIGIIYKLFAVSGLPSRLGVIGEFNFPGVGDVKAATLADVQKGQFILSASIDRFGVESLRQLLASLGLNIPQKYVPPAIEFRDVKMYMAPNAGRIGSVEFQPGYNFEGIMSLFKQNFAHVRILVSENKGIIAEGKVSGNRIGPLAIGSGIIDMQFTPSKQYLIIDTHIFLKVVFEISNKRVKIIVDNKNMIFHVGNPNYEMTATASTNDPSDFTLEGTIHTTVLESLRKSVEQGVNLIRNNLNVLKSGFNEAKKVYDTFRNQLNKFKFPDMCARPKVAAATTLEYDDDEHEVMFRRLRRALRRAKRSVSRAASDAQKKAEEAAKKAAEEARKAAERAAEEARRAAEKAAEEARKAAEKACAEAQKEFKNIASKVKTASNTVEQAAKKFNAEAGKYTSEILSGNLFSLHSISFKTSLNSVARDKSITLSVDVTIVGKRQRLSYNLPSLSKVKDLHTKLLSRIVQK